jgi:signal transduction histidine kinase
VTTGSFLPFERSTDDRVVAGICGGVASALGVDATLVRLVFALLALAGGAGILLYLALWLYADGRRPWLGIAVLVLAVVALLFALGLSPSSVLGVCMIALGIGATVRRGGSIRAGGSLPWAGVALALGGAVILLSTLGTSRALIGPGAIAGALLLVVGPWLWQLSSERTERIRLAERAAIAERVHDSVLQTLALVQRHADDAPRITALARRQERELRRWLYGTGYGSADTLAGSLTDAIADIEDAHNIRVELVSTGDAPLDDQLTQLVLATREAATNAAKHAGVDEVAIYLEVGPESISVFVRDRGAGFDPSAVADDRRGISDSIEARLARAGGAATITSSPGEGTEVELTIPREAP